MFLSLRYPTTLIQGLIKLYACMNLHSADLCFRRFLSTYILLNNFSQNGGTLTQNPCSDTFCVVAERINVRVRNIIR